MLFSLGRQFYRPTLYIKYIISNFILSIKFLKKSTLVYFFFSWQLNRFI